MKNYIVITSINPPNKSIKSFAKLKDYNLLVVGDKKTPLDWQYEGVKFISVMEQSKSLFKLTEKLPFNHYSRKMIGYLEAIKSGAEFIIDTDDDNIPYDTFNFPSFDGTFDLVEKDCGFINIYQFFTDLKIWPRGLPLHLIKNDFKTKLKIGKKTARVGIWQGLADNDPDVDAIYRLTSDNPCVFNKRQPIVLDVNTICPFNTQNTKIIKELFPLLYLPSSVTFRYTDILRGLVAQPIMWQYGYLLGFSEATVTQERNPHDYFKDFISEIPMFLTCEKVIETVSVALNANAGLSDNLYNSYEALLKEKIVDSSELICLEAWISDLEKIDK